MSAGFLLVIHGATDKFAPAGFAPIAIGLGGFRSRVLLYCIFWRFAILVGAGGAIHAAEDNGDKACDGCDGAQEGHLLAKIEWSYW